MNPLLVRIKREQTNALSIFAPRYEYTMGFLPIREQRHWPACIEFGFSTERAGVTKTSRFSGYITTDKFAELARLMFEADPQAAVRAFGMVMQEANIQRSPDEYAKSNAA